MSKKAVKVLSVVIFALLLICTVASTIVYDRNLPRVTAYTPEPGILNGEEYPMVVPSSCVYTDNDGAYVFRLKEVNGEWKVERCTVRIDATDGTQTAIRRIVSEEILVAASPTAPLSDGQIVKLSTL